MRPTIIDVVDGPRIMAFSHCCPSSQILEHASAIGRFGYNLSGYRIFRPPSTTNHVTSPPHSPTMIFQILDVNRVCEPDGFPTVQLFGTTPPNRPVTAHASGFCPNFCVWVDEKRIEAAILEVKSMGLSDEAVERFPPSATGGGLRRCRRAKLRTPSPSGSSGSRSCLFPPSCKRPP